MNLVCPGTLIKRCRGRRVRAGNLLCAHPTKWAEQLDEHDSTYQQRTSARCGDKQHLLFACLDQQAVPTGVSNTVRTIPSIERSAFLLAHGFIPRDSKTSNQLPRFTSVCVGGSAVTSKVAPSARMRSAIRRAFKRDDVVRSAHVSSSNSLN